MIITMSTNETLQFYFTFIDSNLHLLHNIYNLHILHTFYNGTSENRYEYFLQITII